MSKEQKSALTIVAYLLFGFNLEFMIKLAAYLIGWVWFFLCLPFCLALLILVETIFFIKKIHDGYYRSKLRSKSVLGRIPKVK